MSAETLLSRLEGVKRSGIDRWLARCPAHEDKRPSLSVRELGDGRVLVHCFGGCGVDVVLAAAGLSMSDLFPESLLREGQHSMPKAPRIPYADILKAIGTEIWIVAAAGADMLAGRALSTDDRQRLSLAVQRLNNAVAVADGRA